MQSRVNVSRYIYAVVVSIFAIGILTQVYLVGLSLLGRRPSWDAHINLGHTLGAAALLMIVLAYLGKLPYPMKPLSWVAFVTYVLLADIVIFMKDSTPAVAALHPVLAVLLFGVVGYLTVRAWRLVRTAELNVISQPST